MSLVKYLARGIPVPRENSNYVKKSSMFTSLRLPLLFILSALILVSCGGVSGPKVSRDYLEVFYKDGATEADAQRTLDYLYPLWKSDSVDADAKSILLTKSGDTMNFKMVTNPATLTDADYVKIYQTANEFSKSLYGGAPVNIYLTDPEFKTAKVPKLTQRQTAHPIKTPIAKAGC